MLLCAVFYGPSLCRRRAGGRERLDCKKCRQPYSMTTGSRETCKKKTVPRARTRADKHPRAHAVVSSACRYTQAEVTPANRFVVAQTSSRQAEVRYDCHHRVWHLVHPATAEVDANARRDHCPSDERTSSTSSDSGGGGVSSDKTTACDDGIHRGQTAALDSIPYRKDRDGVLDSVTCGSPKRRSNGEVISSFRDTTAE